MIYRRCDRELTQVLLSHDKKPVFRLAVSVVCPYNAFQTIEEVNLFYEDISLVKPQLDGTSSH